jgi:hypothetical protein
MRLEGERRDEPADEREAGPARAKRSNVWSNLALMVGAFVLASGLAGALGAINLGTALAFGQIAFAIATAYVLLRR